MRVLLTGATGFLGEYLLAELLQRGHTVWALYRSDPRKLDTIRFLSSLGLPHSAESLHWFKGQILDVNEHWENWCRQCDGLAEVDTLIHGAASTRLHMDEWGDPLRTNLGSAKELRKLVDRNPMQVHFISTAYVCGFIRGEVVMEVNHDRGDFVNVYEESKWEAEQVWQGDATLVRPAIIIGHSETGRCTSFTGWYILFQAVALLDRLLNSTQNGYRHDLALRVPANPDGNSNIVTVDYVAQATVELIENPANHGKIFHLTHPSPPTHQWTLDLICEKYNLGGITFAGEGAPFTQPRNRIERMVWRQMQPVLFHFSNNPQFDRTNIDKALPNLPVPPVDEPLVARLIAYAEENDWGQGKA